MDFGWLVAGAVNLAVDGVRWLRNQHASMLLVAGGVAAGLIVGWVLARRAGRPVLRESLISDAADLKDLLRRRLAEPSSLFLAPTEGPMMGAGRALEQDIEAAQTILLETKGHRGKAKELLRRRLNGSGVGKLNGSEAAYWRQLGALSLIDSTRDALVAYARAADLSPDDDEAHTLLGVLYMRSDRLDAAEAIFRRLTRLVDGKAAEVARYRGATMLGDVFAARNQPDEALAEYETAQRDLKALLERDPEDANRLRDLSVTHDRIGDVLFTRGQHDAALDSYRRSLEIAENLAKRDPAHADRQQDLSVSYDRIGDVLAAKGDLAAALESYHRGLEIAEALAQSDPGRIEWQWDVSVSLDRIGDLLAALSKVEEALASYRRGLALAETLIDRNPEHLAWQRDLAVSYHKVGSVEAARENAAEARELFERGRAIINRFARIAAHQAQWRSDLLKFEDALRSLDG